MKKLSAICYGLFFTSLSLITFSCSSQKVNVKSCQLVTVPAEEPTFDLSFLEKSKKSHIDSLGNIIIVDPILAIKIKAALSIPADGSIPSSLASNLKKLDIGDKIQSMENQKIHNVDALVFFKNLTEIDAQNNLIKDISPLQELKNLQILNLYNNKVSDISCLSDLKELSDLNLWSNGISNISSLEGLDKLTNLNLGMNNIKNISPLQNCKNLKGLWLFANPVINPEIVSKLSGSLETLSISKCNISEIRFLENCAKIKTLMIFDNKIKDISVLRNMHNLNVLFASNNQIENIDVIPFLVDKGAFLQDSKFRLKSTEISTNIDLTKNQIDYQLEKNQKIKVYLNEKVAGVKF